MRGHHVQYGLWGEEGQTEDKERVRGRQTGMQGEGVLAGKVLKGLGSPAISIPVLPANTGSTRPPLSTTHARTHPQPLRPKVVLQNSLQRVAVGTVAVHGASLEAGGGVRLAAGPAVPLGEVKLGAGAEASRFRREGGADDGVRHEKMTR